ncbi:ceramide synthase 5-like [Halichondria panicea]|uniref:ceramide synthase 5-like n=1 Tax=Halichondria panicea TaxID=6063 RepID=UPI00312B7349
MKMDSSQFWLPPGVKWCRLNRGDPLYLLLAPWIALGLLLLRAFVEDGLLAPMGKWLAISDRSCTTPQLQPKLEKVFKLAKHPSKDLISSLAKEIGWTQYKVHSWFWRARNHKKVSLLTKFKETGWRFLAYLSLVVYGLWANLKEPCVWDLSTCYHGYPTTPPTKEVLLYWAFQLAFYCSLLVSHFKDIRRKDFYQMFVHHITTLALLTFAYTVNMLQTGMLIALVHDLSDVPLELAKMLHYASYEGLAQASFVFFTLMFILTRLVILPFWLIWSVAFDIPALLGSFPALYLFTGCLLLLQMLHLYWFKLIATMVWDLMSKKEMKGDTRSDSELSDCNLSSIDSHSNGLQCERKKSI